MAGSCVGAVQKMVDGMAAFGRIAGLGSLYGADPAFSTTGDRGAEIAALAAESAGRLENAGDGVEDVDQRCPAELAEAARNAGVDIMEHGGREAQRQAIVSAESRQGIQLPHLHARGAPTPRSTAASTLLAKVRALNPEDPNAVNELKGLVAQR